MMNARHMKNVPGRKTDMKDAQWIATLLRAGLLKGSFIPDIGPVHFIRDLDKLAANPYSFFISVHAVFPPISLNCEKFRLAGGPLQRENGVSLY